MCGMVFAFPVAGEDTYVTGQLGVGSAAWVGGERRAQRSASRRRKTIKETTR